MADPKSETTSTSVAADKVAADRAEKAGANEAARSVAEAIKRVADAAVDAVSKVEKVPAQAFQFAGSKQGRFEIRGNDFSTNGTIKVNGHQAKTTEWGASRIIGQMPDGVKAGPVTVEVAVDTENVQRGTFVV